MSFKTETSNCLYSHEIVEKYLGNSPEEISQKLSITQNVDLENKSDTESRMIAVGDCLNKLNTKSYNSLNQEKKVAQSLITYLQTGSTNKQIKSPSNAADQKAVTIYCTIIKDKNQNPEVTQISLTMALKTHIVDYLNPQIRKIKQCHSPIIEIKNEPEEDLLKSNQSQNSDSKITRIITKKISRINSKNKLKNDIKELTMPLELSEISRINRKISKKYKGLKLTETFEEQITKFNAPMLNAYFTIITNPNETIPFYLFEGINNNDKDLVIQMTISAPSQKAYVERLSCLYMENLASMNRLGADYDRHIEYVKINSDFDQPLLNPLDPTLDWNTSGSKLNRITDWFSIFSNQIGMSERLTLELMQQWTEIMSVHFEQDEAVSNSVQAFFLELQNYFGIKERFTSEELIQIDTFAHCMATISQKLYSDPGMCVGNTTRPDGFSSAYIDIPRAKNITIQFSFLGDIEVNVCTERAVHPKFKEENCYFPSVRLKLTNRMQSNLKNIKTWKSEYSIEIEVDRITDAKGKSKIPPQFYESVIAPLLNAGFKIKHVCSK